MWRYTGIATATGACARSSDSVTKRTPLETTQAGTNVVGRRRGAALALEMTSTIEHSEVASSIDGSAVRSSEVRNNASRTALPLTNCAVTAAARIIAATTGLDGCVMRMVTATARRKAGSEP